MLTHELQIKIISLNKRFATTENPTDSKSHKSYTNTLALIIMKSILITFFLVFTMNKVNFDKHTVSYSIMIPKSELIVDGNIKYVSDNQYEFLVNDFIKGEDKRLITVKKWKEWQCDNRYTKYELEQRLVLFLTKNNDGTYEVMNGSTGELIINKDESVDRNSRRPLPKLPIIKEGIKMIMKAIDYKGDFYASSNFKYITLISSSEFENFQNSNDFFKIATRHISFED